MAPKLSKSGIAILKRVKRRVRAAIRGLDRRRISEPEFRDLMAEFGVTAGAVVMVHSSMDGIVRRVPAMTPLRLIETLQDMLGENGTLLMPTFPFAGLQVDYARDNPRFNPKRTPSRVGLLTEIFRRCPGVRRSLHPTHPVAAWGKHAEALLENHHMGTAFGKISPIYRMRDLGGAIVGLGVSPGSFTVLHVPEELHPTTHAYHYGDTPIHMTIVDGGGTIPYELSALRGDRKRDYEHALASMKAERVLRHEIRHGLSMCATHVDAFIVRAMTLIDAGEYSIKDSGALRA